MGEIKDINSLKDIVNKKFELYKDKEAFIQKNKENGEFETIAYSRVKNEINGLGTYMLKKMKIEGKKVAIISENSYEWYVTYMAVACGVGVVVPVNKDLPAEKILELIKKADVSVIVYSSKTKEIILNIKSEIRGCKFIQIDKVEDDSYSLNWRIVVDEGIELLNSGEDSYVKKQVESEDVAVILFKGEEEENSKAVMLSHKNLISNISSFSNLAPNFELYTSCSILAMHYSYEFTLNYLFMTAIGAKVGIAENIADIKEIKPDYIVVVPYILDKISSKITKLEQEDKKNRNEAVSTIFKALSKFGIKAKNSVQTQFNTIYGENLKYICCGSSHVSPEVIKNMEKAGIKINLCYELTECSPLVSSTGFKNNTTGSVGKAVDGVEIRIDLSKNESENSNIGEIIVSGDNVMLGYYNDEELTKKVIKKGWLYTGDLGYFNLNGELIIVGKESNMIKDLNGKKIYPEELELALNNIDLVKDSMVYGKKDGKIVARVELDNAEIRNIYGENIPTDDVLFKVVSEKIKKLNRMIPSYKAIKGVEIKKTPFIRNAAMQIKRKEEIKETRAKDLITKEKLKKK